jgi:Acyl-CoA carboxylase epsilon subunit
MTELPQAEPPLPVFSVVRGRPTADELAALLVVLASRPAPRAARRSSRSLWSSPGQLLGAPVFPGPGAWRASGLPR